MNQYNAHNGYVWMPATSAAIDYHRPATVVPHIKQHTAPSTFPLVTCIMPTRNRQHFVPQAIRLFQRQSYPNKELIIVDDSDVNDVSQLLPAADIRIKFIRIEPLGNGTSHSIGLKRNLAMSYAAGEIFVLWDDDDWYGENRIFAQTSEIISGVCDATAIDRTTLFHTPSKTAWCISDQLRMQMFYEGFVSGTLAFRRSYFDAGCHFQHHSMGEDSEFYRNLKAHGVRFKTVINDRLFVYIRHHFNTWAFEPGVSATPAGWKEIPMQASYFTPEDMVFYGIITPEVYHHQQALLQQQQQQQASLAYPVYNYQAQPTSTFAQYPFMHNQGVLALSS